MKRLSAIVIALALCQTASPPWADAATGDDGRLARASNHRDGLSAASATPFNGSKRLTRIERLAAAAEEVRSNPALASLDDDQALLLDAVPKCQPVLEQLVAPIPPADARQELASAVAPTSRSLATEDLRPMPESEPAPTTRTSQTLVVSGLLLMIAIALRKQLFAVINRLVLGLVVAVSKPGATVSSKSSRRRRRRRRRSTSRRHAPDIGWYFKAVRASSRSHSSSRRRRRWTSTLHPRDYVVNDVVYATAPAAQSIPRYLLTHSAN
jgi:hypothetical protein